MVEKIFNSQSSQETKVYYGKSSETTKNEDDSTITKSSFKEVEIDENQDSNEATQSSEATQTSQESWWSS